MRASVGKRGAAGSTFDHVAREAGVSRGLLHYYFGSKERLLVEVVRRDCDTRMAALEERLADARTRRRVRRRRSSGTLEAFLADDPAPGGALRDAQRLAPQRGDPRRAGRAVPPLARRTLADALREKQREGVVRLDAEPEDVAALLFALGDGMGLQVISDPGVGQRSGLRARRADGAPPARRLARL